MNASENEIFAQWFEKYYVCSECNTCWTDCWSCLCNDRCPACDYETELTSFVDLSRPLTREDYIGAARLLKRSSNEMDSQPTSVQAQEYAQAMMEGGEYRFDPS